MSGVEHSDGDLEDRALAFNPGGLFSGEPTTDFRAVHIAATFDANTGVDLLVLEESD